MVNTYRISVRGFCVPLSSRPPLTLQAADIRSPVSWRQELSSEPISDQLQWEAAAPGTLGTTYRRLRLWRPCPGHLVAVVTETDADTGVSITNVIEHIVARVQAAHPGQNVQLIEHRTNVLPFHAQPWSYHAYDLVTLGAEGHPRWKRLSRADMVAMIGTDLDETDLDDTDTRESVPAPLAPAPVSPAGAAPRRAQAVVLTENSWGAGDTDVCFHPDSAIGRALEEMGPDKFLAIGDDILANVVGKLATQTVDGRLSPQHLADQVAQLRDQVPTGSQAEYALTFGPDQD